MNKHLIRLFVVAITALTLGVGPSLLGQSKLTPSAHAQSKAKIKKKFKQKSFRGPGSRSSFKKQKLKKQALTSRTKFKTSGSKKFISKGSSFRGRSRGFNNRGFNNRGFNNRSFNDGRFRSSHPFSRHRGRHKSFGTKKKLTIALGGGGFGIVDSRGFSKRRFYKDKPFGWKQHGWRSTSWKAPFFKTSKFRPHHRLWGKSHWHDKWGWYYYDVIGKSTLVFIDYQPDNCEYIEYQKDYLLDCGKILYRPLSYKGQRVYEIVDDY